METDKRSAHQQRVEEFMVKAGQTIPDVPTMPSEDIRRLRARLILEEALEAVEVLGFDVYVGSQLVDENTVGYQINDKQNLPKLAKECADICVVTTGTLSACGIKDIPGQVEVDMNNLAKFGPGHTRREDGKLIKPPDHRPPDMVKVLNDQGANL